MADHIVARDEGPKYPNHPEGQFAAICVDVIDLGDQVSNWQGKEKLQHKCAIVFLTGEVNPETERPFEVTERFTVTMGEKGNLRPFLERWRGKSYTQDEADEGAPLHKLVGVSALVTIEHRKSGNGRTYANVAAICPLPKAMPKPEVNGYKRAEYRATVKEENAKAAAAVAIGLAGGFTVKAFAGSATSATPLRGAPAKTS